MQLRLKALPLTFSCVIIFYILNNLSSYLEAVFPPRFPFRFFFYTTANLVAKNRCSSCLLLYDCYWHRMVVRIHSNSTGKCHLYSFPKHVSNIFKPSKTSAFKISYMAEWIFDTIQLCWNRCEMKRLILKGKGKSR